jgi:hypothetical protein
MSSRKIICQVTGKAYTFAKDYFEKKVEEYSGEDSLKKYFITRKAKTYLNKGYSIQEIRNILNADESSIPGADSEDIKELIEFHKIASAGRSKKVSATLNFATHKSDPAVAAYINRIRTYE